MTEEAAAWGKIAIVGRASRLSGVRDVRQFWALLEAGRVAATRLSEEELLAAGVSRRTLADPNYVRSANVLPDVDRFDAGFFGFSPREAAILDPQHRHFLECAWEALEDAGHIPERFAGRIGVFAGVGMQAYFLFNLLSNPDLVRDVGLFLLRHTGNDKDFMPTRLSYLLNLTGPSVAVQTACSTGLVAVHTAVSSLLAMECDMAIAGGVTIEVPHGVGYHYTPGEILSPDGYCRAFDDDSQGTVFGSGVGLVVLRRLQDALDDGDDIKAVILGSAINNDGASKAGYLAPSVDGQAAAAAEALTLAGVPPETVTYLEAHGTGTPIGDPIELTAMTQVYGGGGKQFCGIGSVKTNIGHLDTAAGTASLIKVVEAMRRGRIPPSLNYKKPNSRFDLGSSPFFVVDTLREWPRGAAPRRAGVNSLGVGGTNAHAIVEEAPERAPAVADGPWRLVPFSTRTKVSLAATKPKWLEFLSTETPAMADVAHTLRTGRKSFDERMVIAARTAADLRQALDGKAPLYVHEGSAAGRPPEVVFLFPGAGGQYPGAGADLVSEEPAFAQAVEACFSVMPADAPADLRTMMFERAFDDAEARDRLSRSTWAIPALFVLEYAWAKLWQSRGVEPALILAHSVGEYAGAVIAGVMGLADALRIVVARGRVIDEAPAGAMTTVPLGESEVRALIGDALDIAALNAPEVSVVTGSLQAIEALEARLHGTEHECKRIRVASPGHSRLLDGQLERFRAVFAGVRFQAPKVPFVSSLRGDLGTGDDFVTADYWVRHLRHTVRFTQAVSVVLAQPDRLVLEMGPGQTLAPLVAMAKAAQRPRAIVSSAKKPTDKANDAGVALAAFGALWAHGVPIDWSRIPVAGGRRVSLPTYAFEKQRHWIEPGRGGAAPEADDAPLPIERIADVAQWAETVEWVEAPAVVAGEPRVGPWLVFAQRDETSRAVLAELARNGVETVVVEAGASFAGDGGRFVVRPTEPADFDAVFTALGAVPRQILNLWALGERGARSPTFDAAFVLARTLQALDPPAGSRLLFAVAGAVPAGGALVDDVDAAAVLGVAAVAPREIPGLETAVVDVGRLGDPVAVARRLVDEMRAAGSLGARVAYAGARRFLPRRVRTPFASPTGTPRRLREHGTYLITGGQGGIGRELALFLARSAKAHVALVSRRAPPDAALAAAIRAAGGDAMFVAADVADRGAVATAVDAVKKRFGAIHGVFHAAGVVDDAPLAAKTLASAHAVMAPKIEGGKNLAAIFPPGSLDLFAVFSSTSVTIAPPGQSDYVAANAWLEALAASRDDGLVIAWGVWRDVGMAERTYGSGAGGDGPHPLLGPRQDGPAGEVAFTRRFDPATDWVLAEHVVAGQPVLPGTAYVELAAAAAAVVAPAPGCELQALSLAQPMIFADGLSRLVTVRLRPAAHGHDLVVESRAGQGAPVVEHARARVVAAAPGDDLPASHLRTAAVALARSPGSGRPHQADRVAFGPRWHNVGDVRVGAGVAEGRFALPAEFAADLGAYSVHPALLDMAATVGLHLLADRGDRLVHAPISADRIRLLAPLPREVDARAVMVADTPGRFCAFDVVLRDPAGRVVAIVERFAMRAVEAHALGGAVGDARVTDVLLAHGIRATDAPDVFARALDTGTRHLIVSSVSLDRVRLAMADARPAAAAKARAAAATPTVADPPRGAVETRLAAVWSELLGTAAIGRDDDFFALGGHSLNAVRMLARVRKDLGVDLPLATLFEAPTVRAIAAQVRQRRPELDAEAPRPADAGPAAAADAGARGGLAAVRTIDSTEAQREIYAAILIDPEQSRAYNLSYSFHFTGPLDVKAMATACTQLVARHDSLRCGFAADGMSLVIRRDVPWQMEFADLTVLDEPARQAQLAALHARTVEEPFDLRTGPMFRATLIATATDRHELLIGSHHTVTDGWSIGVLMRDLHALYQAQRRQAPPPPPPASIAEFVAAEKAWQAGPAAEVHRRYWLERFADGAPAMELPTDHVRPQRRTTRAARQDDQLDAGLEAAIRATAKALGSTLPNFVFAAFNLYVARVTGNRDVVIGLPSSGQLAHGLDGVVGHCVNFLPIRTTVAADASFAELVRDVRTNLARALDHQNYAYGALVRDLRLRRDPSRIPLVPVIFNIDNLSDIGSLRFDGVTSTFTMNPRPHEHFEVFVNLLDEPGRVLLSWNHNADLFDRTTIQGHLARFRRLLQGLAHAPDTRLGDAGRLLGGTVRPASGTFDDPGAAGPQTITQVFAAIAAAHGQRTALRFGAQTMDYATLDTRSDALAALLAEKGVRPGDLVGISSRRALELIVAVLGALKAGAGYVPFDTTLPAERLAFMARDTAVKVLLGECEPVARAGVPAIPFGAFPAERRPAPAAAITGASIAYVMFTSGTTGRPKGVVLPHRSVIRMLIDTDWLRLSPDTVTLHSSAFAFDTSIIDIFAALLHGGTVVIPPDGQLSLHQLADAIQSHGVNTLWLTSGLFHAIADLRPEVFGKVDQVIVGGDVVSPVQVEKVMNRCPKVTVINGYGPTESNVTNAHTITRADLATGQALPIGRAIPGTQIWIVDERLVPVEAGVQGELCITGRGLALGYHNRPELTAEKFVQAPWDPALRMYRSGDLAMDPGDGVIRFFGRMDGQVKIRGFRVELGEVEAVLEAHDAIRQAVVVALVPEGRTDKVLAAYLVPEGEPPERRALDAWLKDRLPDFARPSVYKVLASIPLNHNGKVDRRALPPIAADDFAADDTAPEGAIETELAAIWGSLLGMKAVGAEANFFELGGHSLLAVRLFDAIHDRFGVEMPISTLFKHPTVRALAVTIAAAKNAPAAAFDPAQDWDTSVVIHPGPTGGDERPMFIVGGVGGNVNNLYELGQSLGRRRALIGFQTRGILGHAPRATIEEMAAEHLRYLRRHQPNGPYLLSGYSGGALTAYEMARQLEAAGETVTELFIFDSFAPNFAEDFRPKVRQTLLQRLKSEWDLLRDEGIGLLFERTSAFLQSKLVRGPVLEIAKRLRPERYRMKQVEQAWRASAAKYVGGPYGGSVTLLQTEQRALRVRLAYEKDPTLGWGALLGPGHLVRAHVPGDHLRMLHAQNVVALVAVIEDRLRERRAAPVDREPAGAAR